SFKNYLPIRKTIACHPGFSGQSGIACCCSCHYLWFPCTRTRLTCVFLLSFTLRLGCYFVFVQDAPNYAPISSSAFFWVSHILRRHSCSWWRSHSYLLLGDGAVLLSR